MGVTKLLMINKYVTQMGVIWKFWSRRLRNTLALGKNVDNQGASGLRGKFEVKV